MEEGGLRYTVQWMEEGGLRYIVQWMEEGGVVRYSAVDGGRRGCEIYSAVDGGRRVEIQCSGWRKEGL